MRLIQKCPCGGEVEMNYAVDTIGSSRAEREAERNEGRKQIEIFRRAHRPCLKRLGDQPAPVAQAGSVGAVTVPAQQDDLCTGCQVRPGQTHWDNCPHHPPFSQLVYHGGGR